jgi:hypothetical protein
MGVVRTVGQASAAPRHSPILRDFANITGECRGAKRWTNASNHFSPTFWRLRAKMRTRFGSLRVALTDYEQIFRAQEAWILESQVQQGYANRICTSLPSSLRVARNFRLVEPQRAGLDHADWLLCAIRRPIPATGDRHISYRAMIEQLVNAMLGTADNPIGITEDTDNRHHRLSR